MHFGFMKNKTETASLDSKELLELSNPGLPKADTIDLVGVAGIEEPFLITKEGAYVTMLEVPEIDMDIAGRTQNELYERFQMVLTSLPPGTQFQMTILEEPIEPIDDLQYFLKRGKTFKTSADKADRQPSQIKQDMALSNAAYSMVASVAGWFDHIRPKRRRTLITLSYLSGVYNATKKTVMGQYAQVDIAAVRKNKEKASENLEERLTVLQSAFAGAGLSLLRLTPEEMCEAVWRSMHPISSENPELSAGEMAISLLKNQELAQKTAPEQDSYSADISQEQLGYLLAPDSVIERKDCLEVDGVLLAGYVVHDFKPNRPTFLYRLDELRGSWIGTIYVEIMDPAVAADRLSQRETQLSAQEIAKSRQGMLIDFGVHQEVSAVQELRKNLETMGQAPINIRYFVFRTAISKKELADRCRELESLFKTIGVNAFLAQYTQKQLWRSYIPIGNLCTEQKKRNMNASSLSSFYWPQRKRYNEPGGIYMGIDDSTCLPLFMDPFGERMNKTPSFLSIGRPGAGKTVWLKTMMTSIMLAGGSVMAVDIEGELESWCAEYGGRYIEVGRKDGERINVLDVPLDSDDPLILGTEHLISFCEAVRGTAIPQGEEWNAIADAYRLTLLDRGWLIEEGNGQYSVELSEWNSMDAPKLSDIATILGRSNDDVSHSLYEMLRPYVEGVYANYFNQPTTFDIRNEKLVVFSLKSVNSHSSSNQLRVYLWQVLGLMWSEVLWRYSANNSIANHVMLDEVWALLKAPGGSGAIENMARRFRKRRAGLWLATQEVGEFLDSSDARRILSIVGNVFLMDQRPTEARLLQKTFSLNDDLTSFLTRLGTGHGILVTPDKTLRVSVSVPKDWMSF